MSGHRLTGAEEDRLVAASNKPGWFGLMLEEFDTILAMRVAAERERIARAIQTAKPFHPTRNYTAMDAAFDEAARIARQEPDA